MLVENYYKFLSIAYNANNEQIKKAYLTILKKYHPDLYLGDKKYAESITMDLNIAYDTLTKSPESRLSYDHTIFPHAYTNNYYYDKNGNRVPINKNLSRSITESEYDALTAFSFFNKSKFSEYFAFHKNMTPQAWQERKMRLKEQKIIQKKKRLEQKHQKISKPVLNKQSMEEEFNKTKHKLDTAIFIIGLLLLGIIGMIVALNILHK